MRAKFSNQFYIGLSSIFIGAAVFFIFDFTPDVGQVKINDNVDPKYFSTQPVRDAVLAPVIVISEDRLNCNDCHAHIEPSDIQKNYFSAHPDVLLNHGVNNYCSTCHQKEDRNMLSDINGEDVTFMQSQNLCMKCHGTKYRDWENGVHGRINGYWDKSKGPGSRLTCVQCHNPHDPKFKPMEPSPAPNLIRMLDQFIEKENLDE